MKKIFLFIGEALKPDENIERDQAVNSLMTLIFKDKKTEDSIKEFEEFKNKFDQEIANRGINALIEHTTCEEYFDRVNQ